MKRVTVTVVENIKYLRTTIDPNRLID